MCRLVWLFICFQLILIPGYAQVPNHWIEFDQLYYKVPVAKNGIYRVSYTQLQQNGFPVSSINPKNIQLFHRGLEQAILVKGEADEQFNSDDYIEFYGRQNDGTLDVQLYDASKKPANIYHNLYSDTTSYFITVGPLGGKRMQSIGGENTNNLSPEPFHIDEKLLVLANNYNSGTNANNEIFTSNFETGEGWTSTLISQGQSRDYIIENVSQGVSTGPAPLLELSLVGRNNMAHAVQVYVGPTLRLLTSATIPPFEPTQVTQALNWSDVGPDGKVTVRIQVLNQGVLDYVSVSYIKLNYPQQIDAAGATEKVIMLNSPAGEIYFELHNPAPSMRIFDVSDPDEVKTVSTTATTTLNSALVTQSNARLYATNVANTPAKIVKVSFREIDPLQHNYIIISHPRVRKPAGGYDDPVKAFGAYRASVAGGGYDTLIVNSQQLFDQFNYGEKSSLAIYKFIEFLSLKNKPSYLFFIGKGLEIWYQYYRTSNSGTWDHQDLIPTAGFPGSDLTFSLGTGISPDFNKAIPTGRIPVMKPEQVAAYLNKIKETESLAYDGLWRKRILHLSGGIEDWEPAAFKGYLEDFKEIAEGPYLGGTVTSIAKESRDVQVINIAEQVNQGLGLVTFFGHSSTSTLDFDIGYVTNPVLGYNNPGKYPMLLMNGCDVGSFFLRANLFGEDWVMADKKGATAFIAHNAYGLVPNLYRYSHNFYSVGFADSVFIKKGIGDIHRETARRFMQDMDPSVGNLSQIQQMILLADPAVKLFGASKPDLVIKESQLSVQSFNGDPVTVASDSFAIKILVSNYGMAKPGLYRLEVVRTLPDNSSITYDSIFDVPYSTDTVLFVIRKGNENTAGNNLFHITLDADNVVSELNESNNEADYSFSLPLNGTKHLYPRDFAIVQEQQLNLSFQATDLYSEEREFVLEMDTVNTFDSEYKKQFTVKGKVLALQSCELLSKDTLAYYWRTRLASPGPHESGEWVSSTFTYMGESKEGWAQVHFPQYGKNTTVGLVRDDEARLLRFEKSVTPVSVRTYGSASGKSIDSVSLKIAGAEYNLFTQGFSCRWNTINLVAFDRKSTAAYIGVYLKWYEILWTYGGRRMACGREPHVINSFAHNETSTGKHDLIAYVNNVAEGDSVVLYTTGDAYINLWPDDAKAKVGELGISVEQLNSIIGGEPVVIFAKKGATPGSARIFRSDSPTPTTARLKVNQTITGGYSAGVMNSTLVGPAREWDSFKWKAGEISGDDLVSFNIIGVKLNSEETLLIENAVGDQDLSTFDPNVYPYLKIVFKTQDETLLTPVQLRNWIVHFTPVPEGVLLPLSAKTQVSLQEGQTFQNDFAFLNITDKSFPDSLQVKFNFFNQAKNESVLQSFRIKAPLPLDTTYFSVKQNTTGNPGLNDIDLFVNPRIVAEQHYDNNVIQRNNHVNVIRDLFGPVTEVTFNGRAIVNGDFVSPQPLIRINIWDENPYLLKDDTLGVRIFLKKSCEEVDCDPEYVSFKRPDIIWHAATAVHDYYIDFTPSLEAGTYVLSVEAADEKGNKASTPYEIEFRVSNETMLSIIKPHPNPFTSELYYGFTLSGTVVSDFASFEIIDVNGKEIFSRTLRDDLAIGRNLFFWEGVSNEGTFLHSGIYLYRLTVSVSGKEYSRQGKIIISR